ncbi:MAG TPA: hypothetical protein VHM72_06220 [Solirubrobacteraceae bacterium]|nr:hypothetical protein [Solirubrobacteraceae bacterium]
MTGTGTRDSSDGMLHRRLRQGVLVALAATLVLAASASAAALPSWSSPTSVSAGLDGVSCPSYGLCVAVAGTTAEVNTAPSSSASSWHAVGTGVASGHDLLSVSCAPGTTSCVAVGDSGAITATASAQNLSTWTPASSSDAHNLTSVSCPSTSFCLAVDASGGAIYSTNGGANWTLEAGIDGSNDLVGVSCASATLCVAVDTSGNILVSTTPSSGGAWSTAYTDGSALSGVSCSASATCVAVNSSGYAVASAPASSTSTWSATRISSHGLTAVSCTTGAFCVAGDSNGDIYESDDPASTSPTWSGATPDGTGLTAVSCVSDGLCAAVDGTNALTGTLPAPTATTGAASAISQTTATLSATVTPNDATITSCSFNYGTTTAYGASVPCSAAPSATGGAQTVTAQLSGLTASTTYDFQIVATSDDGTSSGANASFATTAPLRPSVSVSGTPAVGDKLTCNVGVSVPAGLSVTYKWVRDTTTIAGATAAIYVVALADQSHHLYCNVMISGDGGTAGASSSYLAVPAETLGTINETTAAKTSVAAGDVTTTITCSPQALSQCAISLRLTTLSGHHTVSIGSKTARLAIGASVKETVSLNATGRQLLTKKHHLKATLTVTGTIVGVISGTIKKQSITLTQGHHARRHAA